MKTEKDEKDSPVSSTVDEVDQSQSASQSPDTTTTSGSDKEVTSAIVSSETKSNSSKKLDEVESTVTNEKCSSESMDVDNADSSKPNEKKYRFKPATNSGAKITARKSTAGKLKSLLKDVDSSSDTQDLSDNASKPSENVCDASEPLPKPSKKYIYKLKAKSGKILRYTSMVPIVLKRPVIKLDKMADTDESKSSTDQTDEADSDNSSKENQGKRNESTATSKRRGRPPLSQKSKTQEDGKSAAEDIKSTYAMQTRKRQLKFLPDGRLVSSKEKRPKITSSDEETSNKVDDDKSDLSYNESDAADESDSSTDPKVKKATTTTSTASKKISQLEKKLTEKIKPKKEFDFESYLREKTSKTQQKSPEKANSTATTTAKKLQTPMNGTSTTNMSKSTTETVRKSAVDPAQLLSSLIGVTILPSQLNVVKFIPKVIHERKNVTSTTSAIKKIASNPKGPILTTQKAPFRFVSKTTSLTTTSVTTTAATSSTSLPKILPKPTTTTVTTLTTPVRKPIERQLFSPSTSFRQFSSIAPKPSTNATSTPLQTIKSNPIVQTNNLSASKENNMPKFDNYTDTRRVYTKNGPKRQRTQMEGGSESCRTVYDLMQKVFDQLPSWNLHVIPDTNTFCIAQVARGRMGLPALVKSIELNESFYAKVYVHQLHCKRFDGVYDSEGKILSLIREIDALAA